MDKVFEFLLENGALIIWSIVIFVALVLAFPRWKRLYKIRVFYQKKKYDLCLIEALNEFNKNPFPKSRTRALTYVLTCALALNEKDIFETNIVNITSTKPRYLGIKLGWETIFQLDQGDIENAVKTYQQLCSLDDRKAQAFSESISDIFTHYDGTKIFSKEEIKRKIDSVIHPALFRIYSEIDKKIR